MVVEVEKVGKNMQVEEVEVKGYEEITWRASTCPVCKELDTPKKKLLQKLTGERQVTKCLFHYRLQFILTLLKNGGDKIFKVEQASSEDNIIFVEFGAEDSDKGFSASILFEIDGDTTLAQVSSRDSVRIYKLSTRDFINHLKDDEIEEIMKVVY